MSERHTIASDRLSATIKADGGELTSLRDAGGEELLWQAGPDWPRHAPVLFPIVGRLKGDTLRHEGRTYRMTQHGLARDSQFEWVERSASGARLALVDSEATRAIYPFAFRLELSYAAEGDTLAVTASVTNTGATLLPFALGAHPAFRWPLAPGVAKEAHRLEFEATESGRIRTVEGGLLAGEAASPLEGRTLRLSPDLFAEDALVMPEVASRSVRFLAPAANGRAPRALAVSWDGYKDLGLWSKPTGADFLCIEPWFGMASPVDWDGEFVDKPGLLRLAPGEARAMSWRVTV